jgi:hypothetical protein
MTGHEFILARNPMGEGSVPALHETVASLERELGRIREGLSLLGIKACTQCQKFFRSEHGTFFDSGQLVCYGCVHPWWQQESGRLSVNDREKIESKLVYWLREQHHAQIVKQYAKLPDASAQEFHIPANCLECRGTGAISGDSCRYCDGGGTVIVVVPKK